MAKNQAIDIKDVKTATKVIESEVLESATLLNHQMMEDMKIKVITNLENISNAFLFDRKTGTTRKYNIGDKLSNTLGKISENELKVTLAWNRIEDNKQNYREVEPFHLNPDGSFNAPNTEFAIRQIGEIYGQDILNNFIFGDEEANKTAKPGLALYDGLLAHINKWKEAGKIKEISIDPFANVTDMTSNYQNFLEFYSHWDPRLQAAPEVLVYCTAETRLRIIQGYLASYIGLQNVNVYQPDFHFVDTPNVRLVPVHAMGTGSKLIATTPYNISYGVDMSDPTSTYLQVDKDQNDFNNFIYQIQTAQGLRIDRPRPAHIAVSSQELTPFDLNEVEDDEEVEP